MEPFTYDESRDLVNKIHKKIGSYWTKDIYFPGMGEVISWVNKSDSKVWELIELAEEDSEGLDKRVA